MLAGEVVGRDAAAAIAPDDFVAEAISPKHAIHQQLDVVTGGGVAVQIDGGGGFHQPPHFGQAICQVAQIGQHTGVAQKGAQPGNRPMRRVCDGVGDALRAFDRRRIPLPGIPEGPDLRRHAVALAEQDIVVGVAVERRVQVNQIDAVVRPLPHPVQAVAVVEGLGVHCILLILLIRLGLTKSAACGNFNLLNEPATRCQGDLPVHPDSRLTTVPTPPVFLERRRYFVNNNWLPCL